MSRKLSNIRSAVSNNPMSVIASLGVSLLCSPFAYGASFDCAKASTSIEEMICSSADLSRLDSSLDAVYKKALTTSKNASEIKESQKRWLHIERNSCANYGCIKAVYEERINELNQPEAEQEDKSVKKGAYRGEYILRAASTIAWR